MIFIVPRTLALHHLPPLCLPASLSLSFAIAFFFSLYFLYAFSLTFAKAIDLVVQGFWFFFFFFFRQDIRLFLGCLREGIFVLAFLVVADASPSRRFKWTACRQGAHGPQQKNATYW